MSNSRLITFAWWCVVAAVVAVLLMRFGMRAVGVRDDLPVPGAIYAVTQPLVEPFYRYFPLEDARFDYHVIEVAPLASAGVVVALGLGMFVVGLLVAEFAQRAST